MKKLSKTIRDRVYTPMHNKPKPEVIGVTDPILDIILDTEYYSTVGAWGWKLVLPIEEGLKA